MPSLHRPSAALWLAFTLLLIPLVSDVRAEDPAISYEKALDYSGRGLYREALLSLKRIEHDDEIANEA